MLNSCACFARCRRTGQTSQRRASSGRRWFLLASLPGLLSQLLYTSSIAGAAFSYQQGIRNSGKTTLAKSSSPCYSLKVPACSSSIMKPKIAERLIHRFEAHTSTVLLRVGLAWFTLVVSKIVGFQLVGWSVLSSTLALCALLILLAETVCAYRKCDCLPNCNYLTLKRYAWLVLLAVGTFFLGIVVALVCQFCDWLPVSSRFALFAVATLPSGLLLIVLSRILETQLRLPTKP